MGVTFVNKNNEYKPISGALTIAAGGALGYKALTSGVRRALGVRIEEHTTTLDNARKIIADGKLLKPGQGGSGASKLFDTFQDASGNFVHITGVHKDFQKAVMDNDLFKEALKADPDALNKLTSNKWYKRLTETPLFDVARAGYRKMQRLMYRATSVLDLQNINEMAANPEVLEKQFGSKSKILGSIKDVLLSRKAKTFYVGGTDNYFNSNFIPDSHDLALKSDKCVKVAKTKFGAMIDALKREGLSGITQNKTRLAAGVLIAGVLGYASYKLIKKGLEKMGVVEDSKK